MKLEEGDRIRIDFKSHHEADGGVHEDWRDVEDAVGRVKDLNRRVVDVTVDVEESGMSHTTEAEELGGWAYRQFVTKIPQDCSECEGDKIYHDTKKEWLCPFCDLK